MDTPERVREFCVKMRKSCLILPEDSSVSRTIYVIFFLFLFRAT